MMKRFEALACIFGALLPYTAAGAPLDARAGGASHGPASTYAECQRKTCPPRAGCPEGTIFVSKDDKHADFDTIQAAILSIADSSEPATILIAPGNYTEQLNVTRSAPLTLLGVSERPHGGELYADITIESPIPENEVQIWWNSANYGNNRFNDNVWTSVLTVGPTLNATLTGAGPTGFAVPEGTPFGCTDFRAYNIDFRNEEFPRASGPAHAVGVSRANAGFYSCGLFSYQDTLYVGKLGNAYFYDNVIAGQTDFLYGFGTAFIDKSTLSLRNCGGGITAWKGTNTTFENKYGVYISESQVIAANTTIATTIKGRCALGRPWNAQHRSIFMESYFDESIRPDGYIQWGTTDPRYSSLTFMAVYDDNGPGWQPDALKANNLTRFLDAGAVQPYRRPVDVFQDEHGTPGDIAWIDRSIKT